MEILLKLNSGKKIRIYFSLYLKVAVWSINTTHTANENSQRLHKNVSWKDKFQLIQFERIYHFETNPYKNISCCLYPKATIPKGS